MNKSEIENVTKHIASKFAKSNFPTSSFDFISDEIELHIRIPSVLPSPLNSGVFSGEIENAQALLSCPAIESIDITSKFQRIGIFTSLVDELLKLDRVKYVCVTNVHNPAFNKALRNSKRWNYIPPLFTLIGSNMNSIASFLKHDKALHYKFIHEFNIAHADILDVDKIIKFNDKMAMSIKQCTTMTDISPYSISNFYTGKPSI